MIKGAAATVNASGTITRMSRATIAEAAEEWQPDAFDQFRSMCPDGIWDLHEHEHERSAGEFASERLDGRSVPNNEPNAVTVVE